MAHFPEYETYDATGLAGLVRKKDVSPEDLLQAAFERIETRNPSINAVVLRMKEQGKAQAANLDPGSPFSGVPFLLKDLMADYAGVPTSYGNKVLRDIPAEIDSELVSRFKKSGLVIIGKTNVPEFGLMGVTESEVFGPCRNPWNTERSPGGSSGGSAAAVAAGIVPMASGGDGGGSIRIPASCCGLFGLKPSRGRNPTGPKLGQAWQGAVQEHVITRSVRDAAAVLDATQGADPGAPYEIRPPARPYTEEVSADPGVLRIAFNTRSPLGTPVHEECIRAVEETARLLEDLGHSVEEAEPPVDGKALAMSYITMYMGEISADIIGYSRMLGRKITARDVEPQTWTLGMLGRSISGAEFVDSIREWDRAARGMGRFFQTYDAYVCPTIAILPPRVGAFQPGAAEAFGVEVVNRLHLGGLLKRSGIVEQMAERGLRGMPFTQLANQCGLPAMSVPLHRSPENLPVGVQFVGPFGAEDILFRIAGQLERAKPWFDTMPDFP